ncbi:hypothetical protein GGR51DRAFT_520433 [Nemania sp. FL0031]|nr:hypothetical protein GGR51DRAFT_520433 [Nemania sp. FL0031]
MPDTRNIEKNAEDRRRRQFPVYYHLIHGVNQTRDREQRETEENRKLTQILDGLMDMMCDMYEEKERIAQELRREKRENWALAWALENARCHHKSKEISFPQGTELIFPEETELYLVEQTDSSEEESDSGDEESDSGEESDLDEGSDLDEESDISGDEDLDEGIDFDEKLALDVETVAEEESELSEEDELPGGPDPAEESRPTDLTEQGLLSLDYNMPSVRGVRIRIFSRIAPDAPHEEPDLSEELNICEESERCTEPGLSEELEQQARVQTRAQMLRQFLAARANRPAGEYEALVGAHFLDELTEWTASLFERTKNLIRRAR